MMRRLAWALAALALIALSFVVGRKSLDFRLLPAIAATLPGDESEFSRELSEAIRARFPLGTNEEALIAFLSDEGFFPDWRRRDEPEKSVFVWNGLLCTKIVRVLWRADTSGLLTEVNGSYESRCV
jgi:hypothetical protein